jgi:apolipoprotein N-acyltransferase
MKMENRWRIKTEFAARYLLASASGLLLALAFPKFSIAGLAWIAPGILLFSAAGCSGRTAFRTGFAGGYCFYLATLYWLLHIPVPFLPILGWLALSAYVAIYVGLWTWLSWKVFPTTLPLTIYPWDVATLDTLLASSWKTRALWSTKCAAIWVALEMVLGRFISGFPWEFLGVSQYKMLPLIQISSVTGVYGVSFLIVWFSVALMLTVVAIVRHPSARAAWSSEIALPLIAVTLATVLGFRAIRRQPTDRPTVKIALIQPSIPQTLIWDERENANRFQQLLKLSEEALAAKPDVMVWPEASVPNMLRHHDATSAAITGLVRKSNVWAILGSDDAEYRAGSLEREIDYFNSAFAISPDGALEGRYIKRQLVIFGEYMPFVEWLPFLRKISPAGEAGFTAGKEPAPFRLDNLGVIASVLICFEDTFPHLVREYIRSDTDFLVNLTNNGWFGESAAQWQHAAAAAFRAVENRVPLVRCANNGLTCWVDETGAMHDIYFPGSANIYQAGFKISNVPILSPGETRRLTFYTRHGDVFGWSCAAWTLFSFLWIRARRKVQSRTIALHFIGGPLFWRT